MTEPQSVEASQAILRFWRNYLSVLEKSSVPPRCRPYYRRAVEDYISADRGHRLLHHTAADVDEYLLAKGRQAAVQEWQFRQIADALRLLFKS